MFQSDDFAIKKHKMVENNVNLDLSKDKDNMFQIDLSELIQNDKMTKLD